MPHLRLPIGIEDFEDIITKEYYYIDKSLIIKDLFDKGGKVNLFTRPRRFGKTLNLSMLKYYFEIPESDAKGRVSDKNLFEGLKIMNCGERYTKEQEQYPVIMLTLKSAKQPTWKLAFKCLKDEIIQEFRRHREILESDRLDVEKELFKAIYYDKCDDEVYVTALKFLSVCLQKHYNKNVVILIDEYDVPLENAFYAGFYDEMIAFIRSLFESALKTNPYLEFAVITGCLRISKESIFTGLNNLKINSILSENYGEYFGFEPNEVYDMLKFYGVESKMDTMKEWYDGYLFGENEVYNPWSVINYTDRLRSNIDAFPTAAWSNTSSNSIVKDLIYHAEPDVRVEIEKLVNGGTIEKKIHEDITYDDIHESKENLWNFLFFTGYLKQVSVRMSGVNRYVTMKIPNSELLYIYENTIENWFRDEVKVLDLSVLYNAIFEGNTKVFEEEVAKQLRTTISYMDSSNKEGFYHGFVLGLLANLKEYYKKLNRESGDGRYDICIYNYDLTNPPIILEFKVADTIDELDAACDAALAQIEDKKYALEWVEDGYTNVICYGVGFFRKQVRVKMTTKKIR